MLFLNILNDFHIENRSIYEVQYSLSILFVIFVACLCIKISKNYVFYSYSIAIDAAMQKIRNIILFERFSAIYKLSLRNYNIIKFMHSPHSMKGSGRKFQGSLQ